jgi:hypothetical protein
LVLPRHGACTYDNKSKFYAKPTKNCPIIHNVGSVLDANIRHIVAAIYTPTEINPTAAYSKGSINLPVEKLGKNIPKKCIINAAKIYSSDIPSWDVANPTTLNGKLIHHTHTLVSMSEP